MTTLYERNITNFQPKRILICGTRKWDKPFFIFCLVAGLRKRWGHDIVIIEGDAPGVDRMAGAAARKLGLEVDEYPADWSKGRAAGPVRNRQMLTEGKPDMVVAVGYGRGTVNMVAQARSAGIPILWRYFYAKIAG